MPRPKSDPETTRNVTKLVKLTREEEQLLKEQSAQTGRSMSEILRDGILPKGSNGNNKQS